MQRRNLGKSNLKVSQAGLGTMIFGTQISELESKTLISYAVDNGINFLDTAEIYSIPTTAETYGLSESIIGKWLQDNRQHRNDFIIATKAMGPSRGNDYVRKNKNVTAQDIIDSCEKSLTRLKTDYIDLFQLHWPERSVPFPGDLYFNPAPKEIETPIYEQLEAFTKLVQQGKILYAGLCNETPYGVSEFVKLAEQHNFTRIASVQNGYSLLNRAVENGLDELLYKLSVGFIGWSPLAFGLLTGKYDTVGVDNVESARLSKYNYKEKNTRWTTPFALTAAKKYNQLATSCGMTPTELALRYCYGKWFVDCTILGASTVGQLTENLSYFGKPLPADVLTKIDNLRLAYRDPVS